MKKFIGLVVLMTVIFFNYEKIDEIFFQINLSKNQLNNDETYFFDLNGDGKKEEIKLEPYKDEYNNFVVNLWVNNKLKEKYKDKSNISVYICDFNKMDKNKEICVILGDKIENIETNIFSYSDENKNENFVIDGKLVKNDNKNGTIGIAYASTDSSSNFKHFSKVIGGQPITINYLYKRVLNVDITDIEEKEVKVAGISEEKEYKVKYKTIVYETNMGDVKAYTLLKGDKIKLISLYNYGNNQCIKVVNEQGRYGWIRIKDKQIFEEIK